MILPLLAVAAPTNFLVEEMVELMSTSAKKSSVERSSHSEWCDSSEWCDISEWCETQASLHSWCVVSISKSCTPSAGHSLGPTADQHRPSSKEQKCMSLQSDSVMWWPSQTSSHPIVPGYPSEPWLS